MQRQQCCRVGVVLDCQGETGAKLAEPVDLRSIPQLWSCVVGSDQKNEIANTSSWNMFSKAQTLRERMELGHPLGVESLLLPVESSQLRWFRHLIRGASRAPPFGGFPSTTNWEETPRQAENSLEDYPIRPRNAWESPRTNWKVLLARWKSRIPWLVILPPQYDAGNAEENGVMDFELSVIEKIDTFTHVCLVNKVHSQQPVSLAKHTYTGNSGKALHISLQTRVPLILLFKSQIEWE